MRLGEAFYRRKVAAAQETLARRELDGLLILNHHQIYYLVGFFHTPTERPVGLYVPQKGNPILFVPKLEEEYVHEGAWAPEVEVYFEFPGVIHPIQWMGERLAAQGFSAARLGFEGSLGVSAHQRLGEAMPGVAWVEAGDIIANLRLVKDPEEIELHRKAAFYSDWMLEEGLRLIRSGGRPSEIEIEQAMASGVIRKMQAELNPVVVVSMLAGALVCSGPRSAFPHGLPSPRRVAPDENLILSVGCAVGGYFAESERTFILGEPTPEQRKRYEAARAAQEIGTQALVPGALCCDVNKKCLSSIREAGLGKYIKHRQGHGIGIQNHEPPWIEDGDATVLRPGMVVSSEPGIYVPNQGGYRISDTVLITAAGSERLTRFPRDLASVTIPI
ncbi:MAG: Xaa-Pro peptidase family protein [Firmicutes bacterium]|nr:Xaa-Pro peptidase family protein [Bacillota bacterium]